MLFTVTIYGGEGNSFREIIESFFFTCSRFPDAILIFLKICTCTFRIDRIFYLYTLTPSTEADFHEGRVLKIDI